MADLVTLAQVRAWLNQQNTTDDALLQQMITQQSDNILAYLNRATLAVAAYTEVYSGVGSRQLMLRQWPVTAVSALSVDGTSIAAQTQPPNGAGYFFQAYDGNPPGRPCLIGLAGYAFNRGLGNITITYSAGYASVPGAIQSAALEIIALRYKERQRIGQTSVSDGQTTTAFEKRGWTESALESLDRYRMVVPV